MRRDQRKQPWQTFPFWFLILSGLAMTVAWKLDLLRPEVEELASTEEVVEEELSPDWASEELATEAVASGDEMVIDEADPIVDATATDETPRSFPDSEVDTTVTSDETMRSAEPTQEESEPVTSGTTSSVVDPDIVSDDELTTAPPGLSLKPAKSSPANLESALQSNTPAGKLEPADPDNRATSRSPFGPSQVEISGVRTRPRPSQSAENATWAKDPTDVEKNEVSGVVAASTEAESALPEQIVQTAAIESDSHSKQVQQLGSVDSRPDGSPVSHTDEPAGGDPFDFTEIDQLIANGEDVEANYQLSTLYWKRPDLRPELKERLKNVSFRIYFAPSPHYMDGYEVQNGDALETIAKGYDVSWEYLAKLNRTNPQKIRAGQTLKVIRGPFAAVVDLSDMELTVHAHGHFVHAFPIGIGEDSASPIGTFQVHEKQRNPTYYGPNGVVENDDPQNPLGEYLLDLGDGFGLHGTCDDSLIGRKAGPGCLRLNKRDVAHLYDLLTVGSEVKIRR